MGKIRKNKKTVSTSRDRSLGPTTELSVKPVKKKLFRATYSSSSSQTI